MLNLLIQLEPKPNLKCINVTQFGKKKITIQIYFHLNPDYFIPYYYSVFLCRNCLYIRHLIGQLRGP